MLGFVLTLGVLGLAQAPFRLNLSPCNALLRILLDSHRNTNYPQSYVISIKFSAYFFLIPLFIALDIFFSCMGRSSLSQSFPGHSDAFVFCSCLFSSVPEFFFFENIISSFLFSQHSPKLSKIAGLCLDHAPAKQAEDFKDPVLS